MRNAFHILLSLFISLGLSSGSVVPIGVTEVKNASSSTSRTSFETSSQSNLQNHSAIKDSEIFEAVHGKPSNLSERSIIYINKKLKTLRRIPLNKYHGYQAFISSSSQDLNRWIIEEKLPQKFVKGRQHQGVNTRPMFDPSIELKKSQSQALYRYVYPEQPKRNKSCMYEEQHSKRTITNESNSEPIEKTEVKYVAKPLMKVFEANNVDFYKNNHKITTIRLPTSTPEQYSKNTDQHRKNMVIKSYTNRKPKSNNRQCGFYKPNWLHRLAFDKNYLAKQDSKNLQDKNNSIDVTSNKDNNLGLTYSDDKLDRYIKEALSELQTQILDNDIDDGRQNKNVQHFEGNVIDSSDRKLEELMAEIGGDQP